MSSFFFPSLAIEGRRRHLCQHDRRYWLPPLWLVLRPRQRDFISTTIHFELVIELPVLSFAATMLSCNKRAKHPLLSRVHHHPFPALACPPYHSSSCHVPAPWPAHLQPQPRRARQQPLLPAAGWLLTGRESSHWKGGQQGRAPHQATGRACQHQSRASPIVARTTGSTIPNAAPWMRLPSPQQPSAARDL